MKIVRFESKYASLAQSFSVNPAKCTNPKYFESYIKETALSDYRMGMATTHVAVNLDKRGSPTDICGFVALKNATLITDTSPLIGYPALEVSELAVNQKYESAGIGRKLLEFVPYLCSVLRDITGFRYLIVCAEEHAVGFYQHVLGFQYAEGIYDIPRELWNKGCVPMYIKLPEIYDGPVYADDEDDEFD